MDKHAVFRGILDQETWNVHVIYVNLCHLCLCLMDSEGRMGLDLEDVRSEEKKAGGFRKLKGYIQFSSIFIGFSWDFP